jgi:hypothetical protein
VNQPGQWFHLERLLDWALWLYMVLERWIDATFVSHMIGLDKDAIYSFHITNVLLGSLHSREQSWLA